jgi:hypothetical protein
MTCRPLARALARSIPILAVCTVGAHAQHDMTRMGMGASTPVIELNASRLGSGTSWLPDSAVLSMLDWRIGGWTVMAHGKGFGTFDRQWTLHGDTRATLLDREMATATRALGRGSLRVSAMTSLESLFLPDTGYPQLLQSGETFHGRRIANTQHPHDLIGELSAAYEYPVIGELALSAYAGVVGDPALGPVAYQHRPSAVDDPFAPLGHHWQDASHGSHGVATLGLFTRWVKVEGSAFNARMPDENRLDIDYGAAKLDSYSGRVTLAPTGSVVASAWVGYLQGDDPLAPRIGMQRYGVSLLTDSRGIRGGRLSTALIWGLNNHHHDARLHDHDAAVQMTHHLSSSVLAEATLGVGPRTRFFTRLEQVQKMADDLAFLGGNLMETFNVRAASLGAAHELTTAHGLAFGAGGRLTFNFLPETLRYTYTTTHPAGFALYLTIAPRRP